jgi:predicted alpha/beta-fold hydrolase
MGRFVPHPSLESGHAMTVYSWGNPRYFPALPDPTRRYFDVDADSRVVSDCHWQMRPSDHPTLIALHGLNGSSDAHYMRGLAAKAFARGFNVVRLNQRNCGDTEQLSVGLFHSGLTADPAHVVHELTEVDGLPAIAVAGYSLGGNLALKLAAEYGAYAPSTLVAVAAVSPIIEIGQCVRALERRSNALYQWNFVKDLKRRLRRKARIRRGLFDLRRLDSVRTVRDFDEVYTAPYFGFRNADDYYHRASALRIIERVALPALIITAEDDPFVPAQPFHDPRLTGNPHIDLRLCEHGGHCGFVGSSLDAQVHGGTGADSVTAADSAVKNDGYWAETEIVDFVERAITARAAARGGP